MRECAIGSEEPEREEVDAEVGMDEDLRPKDASRQRSSANILAFPAKTLSEVDVIDGSNTVAESQEARKVSKNLLNVSGELSRRLEGRSSVKR